MANRRDGRLRIGLLIEEIWRADRLLWWGSCHKEAWPALKTTLATEGADYLAVEFRPQGVEHEFLVFATAKFSCKPAPTLADKLHLPGRSANQIPPAGACSAMLTMAHADGVHLSVSDGWLDLILNDNEGRI